MKSVQNLTLASLLSFTITCFAQAPQVVMDPASIDFGDIEIHTASLAQQVTITNHSNGTIDVISPNISDGVSFTFSGLCTSIAPQESCSYDINFNPETLGSKTAMLSAHTSMGDISSTFHGFGILPVTNDDIIQAHALTPTFTETLTTRDATQNAGDPRPLACETGTDSRIQTVWFVFHPSANGWLQVDTRGSDFNTALSIWSGAPGSLAFNACDDDEKADVTTSLVALPVSTASDYYIMVAGKTGADTGILNFNSTFQTDQSIKQQEITNASVTPGQSSTFKVNAQFEGDTNLAVNISPSAPTISCMATPNQLQFYGAGASRFAMVNVKCTTVGPNAAVMPPARGSLWPATLFATFLFGLVLIPRKRNAALLCAITGGLILASCGGGGKTASAPPPSSSSAPTTVNPSTAPGTYTISLTGLPKQVVGSPMTLVVH